MRYTDDFFNLYVENIVAMNFNGYLVDSFVIC